MTAPTVSVVIVSHGRPASLGICLTGVGQIDYPNFEIVIVADQSGIDAVNAHALGDQVKLVLFDEMNIPAARNAGVAAAAGEIIAFIDDDAIPEPTWLTHLIAPFADESVAVAGGYVIGRNGISFQWKARTVSPDAHTEDLILDYDRPQVFEGSRTRAIKTEGTNMAVRRDVLVHLGGFDPAFRFYLDETDLNMRIGKAGLKTAIVPLAQVHHGFAPSARRRDDRVPRDLFEIGASLAVYLCKHDGNLAAFPLERTAQRHRLLSHMVAGRLLPSDVAKILTTFDVGWDAGRARIFGQLSDLGKANDFKLLKPKMSPERLVISGRIWERRKLMASAVEATKAGRRVSLMLLSPTVAYHHIRFVADGYWLQSGGLFGKSLRSDPIWRFWRFADRVARECQRIASVR